MQITFPCGARPSAPAVDGPELPQRDHRGAGPRAGRKSGRAEKAIVHRAIAVALQMTSLVGTVPHSCWFSPKRQRRCSRFLTRLGPTTISKPFFGLGIAWNSGAGNPLVFFSA